MTIKWTACSHTICQKLRAKSDEKERERGSVCERECVSERKKEEIKERRERERKIFYDPVTGQGLLTP